MQRSWLRLLISALVIVAALTAAAANGFAPPAAHPCAEMAMGQASPAAHDAHGDHAAPPRHCDSLICGALQLTPASVATASVTARRDPATQPRDDAAPLGFAGPPDLRPPIS